MGAVTVATNMAGRGTDIVLGGSPEGRDADEWLEEHDKVLSWVDCSYLARNDTKPAA